MTSQNARSRPEPRAQTLRLQRAANLVIRGVLRTPLLCRLAGKRLVIVYAIGRKTGTRYSVPVAYTRENGTLLVGTPFAWGANLRTGEPVDLRLKGRRVPADVQVISDVDGVIDSYAAMARDNHQFARFNQIGFDEAGNPEGGDLRLAWAGGARAFRFTPR